MVCVCTEGSESFCKGLSICASASVADLGLEIEQEGMTFHCVE